MTLFAVKINSLDAVIQQEILASLFVSDLQIVYSNNSLNKCNYTSQQTIDSVSE